MGTQVSHLAWENEFLLNSLFHRSYYPFTFPNISILFSFSAGISETHFKHVKDTKLIMTFHHHYKLNDSFCKIHRPGLLNVYQLGNIPFNLTQGKIQLENIPFIRTGCLKVLPMYPAIYYVYLVHRNDEALSCKYVY